MHDHAAADRERQSSCRVVAQALPAVVHGLDDDPAGGQMIECPVWWQPVRSISIAPQRNRRSGHHRCRGRRRTRARRDHIPPRNMRKTRHRKPSRRLCAHHEDEGNNHRRHKPPHPARDYETRIEPSPYRDAVSGTISSGVLTRLVFRARSRPGRQASSASRSTRPHGCGLGSDQGASLGPTARQRPGAGSMLHGLGSSPRRSSRTRAAREPRSSRGTGAGLGVARACLRPMQGRRLPSG